MMMKYYENAIFQPNKNEKISNLYAALMKENYALNAQFSMFTSSLMWVIFKYNRLQMILEAGG